MKKKSLKGAAYDEKQNTDKVFSKSFLENLESQENRYTVTKVCSNIAVILMK